jgi:hypothetical protein
VTLPVKKRFDPSFPIADKTGRPVQEFRDYISALDSLVAALAAGGAPTLVNAANDAAAAKAGVALNQIYRNGSALQVRFV